VDLTELQNYVWQQTDTTNSDLPANTIANYLDEAFLRTIAAENIWPYYESQWQLVCPAGQSSMPLADNVNIPGIMSLIQVGAGLRVPQVDQNEAEQRWLLWDDEAIAGDGVFGVGAYSIWARRINLWPPSLANGERTFALRGFRQPMQTFDPNTGQVDADPRLHRALAHFAIALAYAQQEDDVLEGRYMDRWQKDVEMARKAIMDPARNRPIVMYGNWRQRRGVPFSDVLTGGYGAGGSSSMV
jgi:hypothetical protein